MFLLQIIVFHNFMFCLQMFPFKTKKRTTPNDANVLKL